MIEVLYKSTNSQFPCAGTKADFDVTLWPGCKSRLFPQRVYCNVLQILGTCLFICQDHRRQQKNFL